MADGSLIKNYVAGPTASLFHQDSSYFRVVCGPVGSGKSVMMVMEIMIRAMQQAPDQNKVRRTRWAIIRNAYPELKSTTIKTWQTWVPESICPIVYDIPIRGRVQYPMADGTKVDAEILFLALDRPEDVAKLLSLDLTGAWINECRQIDEEVFKYLRGRIKRYPLDDYVKPTWWGIMADTNAPKTTSWLYRIFEEEQTPKQFKLYKQPPAVYWDEEEKKWKVNPDAENLNVLGADYYQEQLEGNTDDYIRVMLAAEYGMSLLGKPVFRQYSEKDHVAKQFLQPDRSMPLILGFDFGLHPACIFGQLGKLGGIRILEELAPSDEDLESFLTDYVNPLIHKKYSQFKIIAVGDPSGVGRSGIDKRTPFETILRFGGFRCVPAHTNSFIPRKEAVDFFLNRKNGLLLDPRLTYLREAFGGGYVYEELKTVRGGYKEKPLKNQYSHGMDAVQYICLYAKGGGARRKAQQPKDKDPNRFIWV